MAEKELTKEEKLIKLRKDLVKQFGEGSIIGASEETPPGDFIPLTSITLCNALGTKGFAKNKITELLGWESSGKTSLSYDAIANAQKEFGDYCLLIDKENSFDKFYFQQLNGDLNKLELSYPNSLEDCYDVIEKSLDSGIFGLIIVDSLTAFQPQSTIDEGSGAMGKESRINSNRMRMVNDKIRTSDCAIVFINQMREKIGMMFGNPETTSGGNALKFYAHQRIMIRRKEIDPKGQKNTMHFKVIKNKLAIPMKEAETTIIWGKGFDKESEIFYLAKDFDIVKKRTTKGVTKVTYGEIVIELAEKDNMKEWDDFLDTNPELKEEIKQKVLDKLNTTPTEQPTLEDISK